MSSTAMAKRAKYKVEGAGIPYRVPEAADLPTRLQLVLSMLYLVYNMGADDPSRAALRGDGLRLARSLAELMPTNRRRRDCWR